jgi:hypothetical protein
MGPVAIAGPTCDGADILYEKSNYRLPLALRSGERVELLSTGAYVTAYASQKFNGFAPPAEHYLWGFTAPFQRLERRCCASVRNVDHDFADRPALLDCAIGIHHRIEIVAVRIEDRFHPAGRPQDSPSRAGSRHDAAALRRSASAAAHRSSPSDDCGSVP